MSKPSPIKNLIAEWHVRQIREAANGSKMEQARVIEYGDLELVSATGRASCKACGQKIAKGEECLQFYWDFRGCGSWTAQEVRIHRHTCPNH